MNLRPLADRVVVKRVEEEERTEGGIILPDTAKEESQKGEVVAVGPGKVENGNRIPVSVKEGDRVLFAKYGGTEIKVDGEEYLIMRESDIMAVID